MEDRIAEMEQQVNDLRGEIDALLAQAKMREQTNAELEKLTSYVRFFVGGAAAILLAIGVWVGTMQSTVLQHDKDIGSNKSEIKSNEARIRSTEQVQAANMATVFAKLDSIKDTVMDIKKRQDAS